MKNLINQATEYNQRLEQRLSCLEKQLTEIKQSLTETRKAVCVIAQAENHTARAMVNVYYKTKENHILEQTEMAISITDKLIADLQDTPTDHTETEQ